MRRGKKKKERKKEAESAEIRLNFPFCFPAVFRVGKAASGKGGGRVLGALWESGG